MYWSCRDYDFTSDDRWNRYRAGIEIPPGRDEEAILHKYKLKWYQREVVSPDCFSTIRVMHHTQLALTQDPSHTPTGPSAGTPSPSDPKPYSSGEHVLCCSGVHCDSRIATFLVDCSMLRQATLWHAFSRDRVVS